MFAAHCPNHDGVVLMGYRSIEEVRNTSAGIAVDYRCSCGYRGTWHNGRGRFATWPGATTDGV